MNVQRLKDQLADEAVDLILWHRGKAQDRFDNSETWSDEYGQGFQDGLELAVNIIESL